MCTQSGNSRRLAHAPELASLAVFGAARSPRFFTLAELGGLPQTVRRATLICAAAPYDARRWETLNWTGVAVRDLLRAVDSLVEAQSVQIAGHDGSLTSLPLTALTDALLALAADGMPLRADQGAPARLIVPGLSACDMPRYVQRITVSTETAAAPAPSEPYAVLRHLEAGTTSTRLSGLVFAAHAVAVRRDAGPPVRVEASDAAEGVASEWALDWPGGLAAGQSFTVAPWPQGGEPVGYADRPLARRWKPHAQQGTIQREPRA